ncbi:acyltransferase [bacterium (candidate division B38) B3_B38]|nr:MAG: acyltransferase [bacterium (candidate division B38) B3_B38]
MKVGVFQLAPQFGEVKKNMERVEKGLQQIKEALIVLPELFNTGYQFTSGEELASLAEKIPDGPTTGRLAELAHKNLLHIVAGIAEREGEKFYNSAVLVGPDGYIDHYRKVHLFLDEKLWFAPGDKAWEIYDIGPAKIGLMICFDWIFPEVARTLVLKGAEVICHPSNLLIPFFGQRAMITRSIENMVYTITCNRTGWEERGGKERITFTGMSQVVSPRGEVFLSLKREEEGVALVGIDPMVARNKSFTPHNDLFRDRRADLYAL